MVWHPHQAVFPAEAREEFSDELLLDTLRIQLGVLFSRKWLFLEGSLEGLVIEAVRQEVDVARLQIRRLEAIPNSVDGEVTRRFRPRETLLRRGGVDASIGD